MLKKFFTSYFYLLDVLNLLPKSDKRKIIYLGLIQFFISIFDLFGLLLIAAVTSIGLNIISLVPIPTSLAFIFTLPIIDTLPLENVVVLLALFAAALLLLKTLTNSLITRKITGFLALREAHLSSQYLNYVATSSPKWQLSKSPQYISGVAMEGANSSITLSLGQLINLIVESCSMLMLFVGISTLDPTITIPSLIFFMVSGWVSLHFLTLRTRNAGRENYFLGISSSELIKNIISGSRELYVSNKQKVAIKQFSDQRIQNYEAVRTRALMAIIPKYISEVTMVLGGIFIALIQFELKNAKEAITGIVVFIALSSRLLPSLLRIQGSILQIRGSSEATNNFLEEFQSAKKASLSSLLTSSNVETNDKFSGSVKLKNVTAHHLGEDNFVLTEVSLEIHEGEFIAIVGPSGAGKTTLVDVILGIISPSEGQTMISGFSPLEAIRKWPNMIRYVPQDVQLISGSILDNIVWPESHLTNPNYDFRELLRLVELDSWVESLKEGINTQINSLGTNISGGQKQRIGIARAMYANPRILILDESTSALDMKTEKEIIRKILSQMKSLTRIVIAHRISTIKEADKIIYLENGYIKAIGSFQEISQLVPGFENAKKY